MYFRVYQTLPASQPASISQNCSQCVSTLRIPIPKQREIQKATLILNERFSNTLVLIKYSTMGLVEYLVTVTHNITISHKKNFSYTLENKHTFKKS